MARSNLGMWMPKQKDGKNWKVEYTFTLRGEVHNKIHLCRIKQDAIDYAHEKRDAIAYINREAKSKFERITNFDFAISKI